MHATVQHKVEAKRFLIMIYTYFYATAVEADFKKKIHHSQSLKVPVQIMYTDTFMLKRSSKLLMWRRNVYDVIDVERRMDARGYISALTEYNFSYIQSM